LAAHCRIIAKYSVAILGSGTQEWPERTGYVLECAALQQTSSNGEPRTRYGWSGIAQQEQKGYLTARERAFLKEATDGLD